MCPCGLKISYKLSQKKCHCKYEITGMHAIFHVFYILANLFYLSLQIDSSAQAPYSHQCYSCSSNSALPFPHMWIQDEIDDSGIRGHTHKVTTWTSWNCPYSMIFTYKKGNFQWFHIIHGSGRNWEETHKYWIIYSVPDTVLGLLYKFHNLSNT